jgi:D-amino peptidase
MKVLVAADMEGISGVVHRDQVDPKHKEYDRFRKVMTADVNAAIRGSFEGGAGEVVVSDGHAAHRNILVEELDPRARLNSGSPSPLSMVQGVDEGVDAAMFVGYHARVGSQLAVLDHVWSGLVAEVQVNGLVVGEIGWNAAVCGYFGVPVILISGDQTACAEARSLLGPIEAVAVKQASGRMAAECLPPAVAQKQIQEAASRAVQRFLSGNAPASYDIGQPVALSVKLNHSDMVDRAMLLPGTRRMEDRRIEFDADDVLTAYRVFRVIAALARE